MSCSSSQVQGCDSHLFWHQVGHLTSAEAPHSRSVLWPQVCKHSLDPSPQLALHTLPNLGCEGKSCPLFLWV